ncbi:ABC transporter permease [Agaribacterium sp. ZY112]|uniref:ABC transporter permease n=1 Tax=Agaribacterium sp. ZY112 TaxID=3233574 RepID=UPI0035258651
MKLNKLFGRSQHPLLRTEAVWVALTLMIVFASFRYDNFLSAYNIESFLIYNSMFILIAIGMCFVIMTGGIDLSVGGVAALASVTAAFVSPHGILPAMLAGAFTGLACGAINGFVVVKLRIAPFIATLAMMLASRGVALIASDRHSVPISWESNFTVYGMGHMFDLIPWTVVVCCVIAVGAWFLLEKLPFGRSVLAVGEDEEAAKLMGLKVNRTLITVYLMSGTLAGIAGVTLAASFGAGQPLEGIGWELLAIAAVVVGGTLLTGGLGSITASIAGVILMGLIFNILNFENGKGSFEISTYWQSVIRGAFLLLVLVVQAELLKRLKKRRSEQTV